HGGVERDLALLLRGGDQRRSDRGRGRRLRAQRRGEERGAGGGPGLEKIASGNCSRPHSVLQPFVMAGRGPAIRTLLVAKAWMPGTRFTLGLAEGQPRVPGMTVPSHTWKILT